MNFGIKTYDCSAIADLVVRSFFDDGEGRLLFGEERRSFLGDVGMAITYRIFLLS
ncbi:MAG: hypothetical protein IM500_17705 [Microcystis sp. M179S2]|uniref:hypothetical protein n=1 Tax=Microcystis sp. M179S2 TaxID=2771160 RepID=UPI002582C2D8|nr:hypothetical protein [Microcystis sp. M179S2]MCA2702183.1 hypothetical protein [Microcystis sp. M179S2]